MCKKWIVLMCLAELLTLGSVASAELVGYWPFDEGAGTTVTDATGLNGDGTFTGDVSWTAGVSRSALHFDGNGDYVTLPNNPRTQLRSGGGFTVAAWVKVEKVDNGVIMMVGQGCSTWASWYLGVGGGEPDAPRNEGNLLFATRTSGGSAYNAAVTPLAPDTWVHIAATHDGTTLVLYQDGVEVNRVAAGTPYQNTDPFYIGGDPGCNGRQWFGGSLDELQIYDAPVAENEIRKIMRGNAAISSDPYPTDGADDVPRDIILSWSAGDFAVAHDVYFGTSFADVNNASRSNPMGVLVSQGQAASRYDPPGVLDFETTYYWRVDEVNAAPDNTIFKGEVWSFTAEPFAYPIANVIATSNGTSDPMAT
ncbi:MAG TPA: LamG domain-containing protein, partial [Sedimentisphaerales bacterium]|nr:LamG domain-containing protein [Sedimentisphaerales bacterium]HRS11676.1 LamG domain-containing protein [Sedimentisphaerales bacterium]HRV48339.1 LamG domain-containing protein [Sedimentisphaerales bacterium]